MSLISQLVPRYKAQGLDTGSEMGNRRVVHGVLTPELLDRLIRLRELLLVAAVMEARLPNISLEVPFELEESFLAALAERDASEPEFPVLSPVSGPGSLAPSEVRDKP